MTMGYKIAIVSDWYLPRIGGLELHLRDLARELNARGHTAHVITATPGPDELDGIRVHRLDVPLMPVAPSPAGSSDKMTLHEARDRFERDLILRTLAEQQGNMSRTADVLGVERSNLYRKMKSFGIAPSSRTGAPESETT